MAAEEEPSLILAPTEILEEYLLHLDPSLFKMLAKVINDSLRYVRDLMNTSGKEKSKQISDLLRS